MQEITLAELEVLSVLGLKELSSLVKKLTHF